MRKKIAKILIADDHELIRTGMRRQLWELSREATITEACDWIETLAAVSAYPELELAVVDLCMPGKDGLLALAELLQTNPELPILVYSASEKIDDIRSALSLGVMGYVHKRETSAVMLDAIQLVLDGGMYIPPVLAGLHMNSQKPHQPSGSALNLTERQLEVLQLTIEGKSNKEIAKSLHLAHATVKAHLATIFRSLKVKNRTQAAISAERLVQYPKGHA